MSSDLCTSACHIRLPFALRYLHFQRHWHRTLVHAWVIAPSFRHINALYFLKELVLQTVQRKTWMLRAIAHPLHHSKVLYRHNSLPLNLAPSQACNTQPIWLRQLLLQLCHYVWFLWETLCTFRALKYCSASSPHESILDTWSSLTTEEDEVDAEEENFHLLPFETQAKASYHILSTVGSLLVAVLTSYCQRSPFTWAIQSDL